MAIGRSFAEYIEDKCYDRLYKAAEKYVDDNWKSLHLYSKRIHHIDSVEISDATIQRVYIRDLPDTRVAFEVGLELEVNIQDYHYDEDDQCYPWIRIYCEGDLACELDDWKIIKIEPYSKKNAPANSLSDALVPIIPYNRLDAAATDFLRENYPQALKITETGQPPISVDPVEVAKKLTLTIKQQSIREDTSVFGQIYFEETDAEMYDEDLEQTVTKHIDAKTIVVDPKMFLLRNLGSVNNTIIHECVHWALHRKVFLLEKMYNSNVSNISCEVVGGALSAVAKSASERMEKQANQLTPRIQMPAAPFKAKATEYIIKYMREMNAKHPIEVMEQVITELEIGFCVSRLAAKIRLVELGFEEAIGTYTYVDNHYVKPHSFSKGALKINQTFSISAYDAAVQRLTNRELHELTKDGDYLFIDNHYVYNAPPYVCREDSGKLDLTDYARSHMDECCLIFDLTITGTVGTDYHTACFLNREESNFTFAVKFHNGFENAPKQRQIEMRKKQKQEECDIRLKMTDDPKQCMDLLLDWKKMNYAELSGIIDCDSKTISRIAKGETVPKLETAVRICFGLHLPPSISTKLLEVLGCRLSMTNINHQWIREALYIKYPESIEAVQEYLAPYDVKI